MNVKITESAKFCSFEGIPRLHPLFAAQITQRRILVHAAISIRMASRPNPDTHNMIRKTLLGGLAATTLMIILIAGLWPFSSHLRNNVQQSPQKDALVFGGEGVIFSEPSKPFQKSLTGSISFEILLQPTQPDASNVFAEFFGMNGETKLTLRQYKDEL